MASLVSRVSILDTGFSGESEVRFRAVGELGGIECIPTKSDAKWRNNHEFSAFHRYLSDSSKKVKLAEVTES